MVFQYHRQSHPSRPVMMTQIEHCLQIRAASPVLQDGLAYAYYLDIAAEGFFRLMLGPDATRIIANAYLEAGHDLSHENVLFAEKGGDIVGMAGGFTSTQHKRFTDQPLTQAAGNKRLRMKAIKLAFAPMVRILKSIGEGDFYVLCLATDAASRGLGIGSRLMDAMEARALEYGTRRITLDVAANNQGAIRFYEKRGMVVESRWPRRVHLPKLTLYRMVKIL